MDVVCPYCQSAAAITRDHIFPQSFGGKRTVTACRACNSEFGCTFESHTLETLILPLSTLLADAGVPMNAMSSVWTRGLIDQNGCLYDVTFEGGAIQVEMEPLLVSRRKEEKLFTFLATETPRTETRLVRRMGGRKKVKSIEAGSRGNPNSLRFRVPIEISDDAPNRRTALKMALALLAAELPEALPYCVRSRTELKGSESTRIPLCSRGDFRLHPNLYKLRPALAHTIYIEQQGEVINAVVAYFGSFQYWLTLAEHAPPLLAHGLLATLDIVENREVYARIEPRLGLQSVVDGEVQLDLMIGVFNQSALERGCKRPEVFPMASLGFRLDGVELPKLLLPSAMFNLLPCAGFFRFDPLGTEAYGKIPNMNAAKR